MHQSLRSAPWAILPDVLTALTEAARDRPYMTLGEEQQTALWQAAEQRAQPQRMSRVAVLPLAGPIAQHMDLFMAFFGGTSTEMFGAVLRGLVADDTIDAIVLNVDSPGGSVFGVQELADSILAMRGRKPIVAVANSLAASAAYWIASAADELVVTPSGEVGSIGVYALHVDESQALANEGLVVSFVSAGKYKVEGNPAAPLDDEARSFMQKRVNEYYDAFVKGVARGRGVDAASVRNGYGEGRVVGARDALKAGMVDRVATLDETIARLGSAGARQAAMRHAVSDASLYAASWRSQLAPVAVTVNSYAIDGSTDGPMTLHVTPPPHWMAAYADEGPRVVIGTYDTSLDLEPDPPPEVPGGDESNTEAEAASPASFVGSSGGLNPPVQAERRPIMALGRLAEIQQERADLQRENEAVTSAVDAAGRDFTPQEEAGINDRNARIDYLDRQAALFESVREKDRAEAAASSTVAARVRPNSGTGSRGLAEDKPWGYDFGVRMVEAGGDRGTRFGGVRNAFDIALGEFLGAVMEAGSAGGYKDVRLFRAGPSGGSTGVPSDGGFAVQSDFSNALLDMAMTEAVLAPRCRVFELSANADKLEAPYINETSRATGSRWGGVRVYRRAEADTVTSSKPKIGKFELELEDLMGIAYMTGRLRQDAAVMGQIYRDAFVSEFAFVLDDEIVRGTGVGQCQGILNADATVSVSAESGQGADTIFAENIMNMWARMLPRSHNNAVWLTNVAALPQLQTLTLNVGTGGALVYMPPGGLSGEPYATIYGRPVLSIEQASALGDAGDIILADLSQYILVRKGGIQEAESMHVRFLYDEMAFRWMYRVNGRPMLDSAITPYKGANTLSPFVTLAAR